MPDRTSLTTLADDSHLLELYRQALKEYRQEGSMHDRSPRIFSATLQAIEEAEAKAGTLSGQ